MHNTNETPLEVRTFFTCDKIPDIFKGFSEGKDYLLNGYLESKIKGEIISIELINICLKSKFPDNLVIRQENIWDMPVEPLGNIIVDNEHIRQAYLQKVRDEYPNS